MTLSTTIKMLIPHTVLENISKVESDGQKETQQVVK
jgi:hypothetical protein